MDPALGTRSYAANAYLPPAVRGRVNLTVRTGVEVRKVVLENLDYDGDVVATGVEFTDSIAGMTTTTKATARREVIIAAGTFGSPKLLEHSGIGDARRQLGGDADHRVVVVENPGVGENLQNHPLATVSFEVVTGGANDGGAPPTKDAFLRAALRQDEKVLGAAVKQYIERRTGQFASSGVTSAALLPLPGLATPEGREELEDHFKHSTVVSGPNGDSFAVAHERFVRDMVLSTSEASGYYIFGPAYAPFNPDGTSGQPPLDDGSEDSYITVAIMLAHPLSRGSVHVIGAGAEQTLVIDPGLLSHPLDLEVMARHVQFVEQRLAAAEPLAKWLKPGGKRAAGAPEAGTLKDLEVAKGYVIHTSELPSPPTHIFLFPVLSLLTQVSGEKIGES